ncbi:MAG: PP2C family protein-serine/threonine phosphatase [Acidobacteriota bacterium]
MTAVAQLPVAPKRTYGWRTWREPLVEIFLAVALGCAVTLIEGGGKDEMPGLRTFVRNAIIASSILILSRGLETMLSWAIEQSRVPVVLRTLIYALGAWVGLFAGLLVVATIYGAEDDDFRFHSFHFIYSITAAVLISCVVGFILHHNRKRNDRLRQSIERLKEHEFAEKELEIARAMQQRLLPPPEIDAGGYHVSARTEAAHIIGGDFYDVLRLDDGSIAVIAADVSGKGIAASLIMATCKAIIPFFAKGNSPAEVMNKLNAKLCDELQRREFVALTYAQFDATGGGVQIVNAGMPDPLLVREGHCRVVSCRGDRYPLGVRREVRYEATSVTFADGERLVMFSDGLPEASAHGEPLGYDRIESLAVQSASVDDFLARVRAIPNIAIDDDATVVIVSRTG